MSFAPFSAQDRMSRRAFNERFAGMLTDDTAALFGLTGAATPDDVFRVLYAGDPSKAIIAFRFADFEGPIPNVLITSNSGGDFAGVAVKNTWSNQYGVRAFSVSPGTYGYKIIWPIGYTIVDATYSATVVAGEVKFQSHMGVRSIQEREFTVGGYVGVAAYLSAIDLFGTGGGGSGAVAARSTGKPASALTAGGAGGFTETKKNYINFAKQVPFVVKAEVGSGGAAVSCIVRAAGYNGKAGGNSSVAVVVPSSETILSVRGGSGGAYVRNENNQVSLSGTSGGSGTGGIAATYVSGSGALVQVAAGGSDGNTGGSANLNGVTAGGGSGQGTTTRKWGETSGELYCGAGGGAATYIAPGSVGEKAASGNGGLGGGGGRGTTASTGTHTALDGTAYGSGGGGVAAVTCDGEDVVTLTSGAGKQGIIFIRGVT